MEKINKERKKERNIEGKTKRKKDRKKERQKGVNTPGLGPSHYHSVLQTGGTKKGADILFCRTAQAIQLEHYMLSQLRAAHAKPTGTAHAQPA